MDRAKLKYAKTHEWLALEGEIATIGITDFAVRQLTDLVFIELPQVGRKLAAGNTFGEVESVKAVSDLYAPASGEVVQVNAKLTEDLQLLSDDPFGAGWMIKLKLDPGAKLDHLMEIGAYEEHCAHEAH